MGDWKYPDRRGSRGTLSRDGERRDVAELASDARWTAFCQNREGGPLPDR
jgi:hypothetical protein